MAKYLLRRFVQLVVVTFIISVLVFLLVHLLPGDPATVILGLERHRPQPGRPAASSWGSTSR